MTDDFDFTKPAPAPKPASPDGFDFTKPPPAEASAPFKPASSQFYNPLVASKLFQEAGKEERFAAGQQLFAEADKAKGGLFTKGSNRMYYIAQGEVALTIGGKPLDTVKKGEIVGEMALISERPRSATGTAKSAVLAYSLDSAELQSALMRTPEFALMLMSVMFDRVRFVAARLAARKVAALALARESPTFDPALLQQFESALSRASVVRYQGGQNIMKEGQSGMYMYVVKSGRVAIHLKDKVLEIVNPGGTFGEMALVDHASRSATATAETECQLLSISRSDFLNLVKTKPGFAISLLKTIADRLRNMTAQKK